MAVEEQPPVANAAGASGTTAMDVDTGSKSKYVLAYRNLHTPVVVTGALRYHLHCVCLATLYNWHKPCISVLTDLRASAARDLRDIARLCGHAPVD